MSKTVLEIFEHGPDKFRRKLAKQSRYFSQSKRKSLNNFSERKPLIATSNDSFSDEEITLHDVRDLNPKHKRPLKETSINNLRRVHKNEESAVNGTVCNGEEGTQSLDPFRYCEFVHLKIEEGDTLQSIAIRYRCSISDLKRANNLISNQDFYALQHLKIPVIKHSLLTENLPSVHKVSTSSTTIEDDHSDFTRTINIGIGPLGHDTAPHEAAAFFKRMDEDLVKIMLSTKNKKDSLEDAAAALTIPRIKPLVIDPYNGVDCGLQWSYLVVFVIGVALVIPFIALFVYMKSSDESDRGVFNGDSSIFSTVATLNPKGKS